MGDKHGTADNIGPQPSLGSRSQDASGRWWVKVRALTTGAWREALCHAIVATRCQAHDADDRVRDMGYELVERATIKPCSQRPPR